MKTKVIARCIAALLAAILIAGVFTACSDNKKSDASGSDKSTQKATVAVTEAPTEEPTEAPLNGFVEENGVKFYYINGEKQTETVVGNDTEGYFYVSKNGAVDPGYCNGLTIDGTDWIVINGEAYKVETESDKCLFVAAKDIGACTDSTMSKEQKIKVSFDYIREHYLEGVRHDPPYPYTSLDWVLEDANDLFVYGKGDCYSFGAAFAYYGRAIGCEESYACNSGGHGWSEIENKVYDPEWSMHSNNYPYFAMGYDDECDVPYKDTIEDGADFKRVKIEIHGKYAPGEVGGDDNANADEGNNADAEAGNNADAGYEADPGEENLSQE